MSDSAGTALGSSSRDGGGSSGTPRVKPQRQPGSGGGRIRSIGTFYRQVVAELRKVIWPTRKELVTYTSVVLFFVLVMVAVVAVFDLVFGKAVLAVFGQ